MIVVENPQITQDSPRQDILDELADVNTIAQGLHPSPVYDVAHERINQLLDWLVGR